MNVPIPAPPAFAVDWPAIDSSLEWIAGLADCPQDPIHHAEGNVLIHTRMVVEAMASLPAWRALPASERRTVFLAALFHDIAKPECTRVEDGGRVTARGHSLRGENMARVFLYKAGVDPDEREAIAALIRYHQTPFFLIERADAKKTLHRVSQAARCDHLALVAEADARGRTCADLARLLDNIALFLETCREEACLSSPRAFASDHSRFLYFRKDARDPLHEAWDDTICEMVLTSGLPASGKDTWLAKNQPGLPVVSLDAVRDELDVKPTDDQGRVVQAAREKAREHLREKRDFAINATTLAREFRERWIDLAADYNARIRIVAIETPWKTLLARNDAREASVPRAALERMLLRWQYPDPAEAHRVLRVVSG